VQREFLGFLFESQIIEKAKSLFIWKKIIVIGHLSLLQNNVAETD